jgi:hypothetical protein
VKVTGHLYITEVDEWNFTYTLPILLDDVVSRHSDHLSISKLYLEEVRLQIELYFNGNESTCLGSRDGMECLA